jgi:hypothetical protein
MEAPETNDLGVYRMGKHGFNHKEKYKEMYEISYW